jgi:hypothetical protein
VNDIVYSAKFHPPVPPTLEVTCAVEGHSISIDVRDTNTGRLLRSQISSLSEDEQHLIDDKKTLKALYATVTLLSEMLAEALDRAEKAEKTQ